MLRRVVNVFVMVALSGAVYACAAVEDGDENGQAGDEELDEIESRAQCEGGANGFRDIPDTLRASRVYSINLGPDTRYPRATLYHGIVGGVQRGWAMIEGSTHTGDLVWMDWTKDGGRTWIQCGPFPVDDNGWTKTSAAQRTNSSTNWRFRACGRAHGLYSQCGAWW
jgi:hypothetical protein